MAYVVSRFPTDAETFVVREMNAVAEAGGLELRLFSLYPPPEPLLHPAARRWAERPHRPTPWRAARDLSWWLVRRPLRLAATAATIVHGHARSPSMLVRALATLPLAASHARTAEREGIDHLHAHFATYPALAAWVVWRLTGVPYSFTAHAHDLFVDQAFLPRKVSDARFVAVISEFNRRFLEPYGGGTATPVELVRCGVDPGGYRFRPRCPPGEGTVRAVCVASLDEHKGHPVLLRAIAAGGGRLERLQLDLVGGRDRRPLERLAGELGIAHRVHFHGALDEEEVAGMLNRADLFVLPSIVARDGQMEGIPVALMEALASGLCVVASRLSGIPELIRDGETGLLAEPGDEESLRDALERALDGNCGGADPAAARRLVETEFDAERSGRRMAELLLASRR